MVLSQRAAGNTRSPATSAVLHIKLCLRVTRSEKRGCVMPPRLWRECFQGPTKSLKWHRLRLRPGDYTPLSGQQSGTWVWGTSAIQRCLGYGDSTPQAAFRKPGSRAADVLELASWMDFMVLKPIKNHWIMLNLCAMRLFGSKWMFYTNYLLVFQHSSRTFRFESGLESRGEGLSLRLK